MKKSIIILTTAALGLLGFSFAVLSHTPVEYFHVVAIDRTDTLLVKPDLNRLIPLFGWRDPTLARTVRVREFTDIDHGGVVVLHLDAQNIPYEPSTWVFNKNGFIRLGEIRAFEDTVGTVIAGSVAGMTWHPRTSLWRGLVEELVELQRHPHAIRTLTIFSDLAEYDAETNVITSTEATAMIERDDLRLWQSIPGVAALRDLRGVRVTLIYQPRSNEGNARYRKLSTYIRKRLEELGAEVSVEGDTRLISM